MRPASLVAWRWRVVEIRRDGDDRLGDLLAELGFGVGLELGEDQRGDFRRGVRLLLAVDVDFDGRVAVVGVDDLVGNALFLVLDLGELASHEALDGENGVGRVGDRLALGRLADETLAALGEGDDGRRRARAFGVFEDHRLAVFHDGHAGVGRAEVDA